MHTPREKPNANEAANIIDNGLGDESAPLLFEIAWEVCNQVGGIYTVLRSKAAVTSELYGDRYCLIGPYIPNKAEMEFEELDPGPILGPTIEAMKRRGYNWHYGRWLVTGHPRVLLVDVYNAMWRLNDFKYSFWADCGINYPDSDAETNNAVTFGYLILEFFQQLCADKSTDRPLVAHFHEWLAGPALPLIRQRNLPIATLFTTHATLLGRYMCASTHDFYERLPWVNADYEAGDRQIYHRYCIERAATAAAHVFTTVSDITAIEADHLLKRRPEKILPNGLRVEKFAALHEFQNLHRQCKEKINDFVQGYFFSSYSFDLDKTLYFFISGRYEYHNKGIDFFIESLSRLNNHLVHSGSDMTVVAFIITSAPVHTMNVQVLQNLANFEELKNTCERMSEDIYERLFSYAARGELPQSEKLLTDTDMVLLKRLLHTRRRADLPPIVTHHMVNDSEDPVLRHIRHRGLFNNAHDRVKVVFHPEFLTRTSPLLGMDYPDFVRGCHLGIFPSYYEPWGYTPAECMTMAVPSICSDLSGFGAFMQSNFPDHDDHGIFVIRRRHVDPAQSIDQLTDRMIRFTRLNRRQRIELRNAVERLSECIDWSQLNPAYEEARQLAIRRAFPKLPMGEHVHTGGHSTAG